jgi:integrase
MSTHDNLSFGAQSRGSRPRCGDVSATVTRTIQAVLGHESMRTTEIYMRVTQPGTEQLQQVLDRLMADL